MNFGLADWTDTTDCLLLTASRGSVTRLKSAATTNALSLAN